MNERIRYSSSPSPGLRTSSFTWIVFTYAVVVLYGRFAPARRALSINDSIKK
jgi:hypothetical protein